MADRDEVAYAIIEPHFDAVRDIYAEYEPEPGAPLDKVRGTKLVVSDDVRDSERHYAGCRDDGLLVVMAPEAADLDIDTLVPILVHELGHAVDFLYPGHWFAMRGEKAVWLPEDVKRVPGMPGMGRFRREWSERTDDQVEWDADSIAYAVTDTRVEYCGPCMLQCFSGGRLRPAGLR
jgi:hypothetical protein